MKALWKVLSVAVIAASLITAQALRAEKNSANASVPDSFDQSVNNNAQELVADGRQIFRFDTFGDEAYWGGTRRRFSADGGILARCTRIRKCHAVQAAVLLCLLASSLGMSVKARPSGCRSLVATSR